MCVNGANNAREMKPDRRLLDMENDGCGHDGALHEMQSARTLHE